MELEDDNEDGAMEIKLMGVLGLSYSNLQGVKTMKLTGSIGGISLMVLIDSEASHKFIAPSVVLALGLQFNTSQRLGVRLGDGHRIWTLGKCVELPLQLDKENMTVDVYVSDLGGIDLILGVV